MKVLAGKWGIVDGVIRQSDLDENRRLVLTSARVNPGHKSVLRLKARKISGDEGFIIVLAGGPEGALQWNLGGWGNTVHAFQRDDARVGPGVPGRIEADRWYDIRIEHEGAKTRGYLDGKLIEEIEEHGTPDFAAVAGIDRNQRELIVKVVNGRSQMRTMQLDIDHAALGARATAIELFGTHLDQENSFEQPTAIAPKRRTFPTGPKITYRFLPYSLTVLRIPLVGGISSAKN
jgi:alpha-L-arabinofuranosidase